MAIRETGTCKSTYSWQIFCNERARTTNATRWLFENHCADETRPVRAQSHDSVRRPDPGSKFLSIDDAPHMPQSSVHVPMICNPLGRWASCSQPAQPQPSSQLLVASQYRAGCLVVFQGRQQSQVSNNASFFMRPWARGAFSCVCFGGSPAPLRRKSENGNQGSAKKARAKSRQVFGD